MKDAKMYSDGSGEASDGVKSVITEYISRLFPKDHGDSESLPVKYDDP